MVRTADVGKTWRKTTSWDVLDVRSIAFDRSNPDLVYAVTMWGPLRSVDAGQTWTLTQSGLDRLYCQTVVVDRAQAGRVLIGMEEGIYASTDAALTWNRLDFPTATVTRLVQSPTEPQRMLAVTLGQGAWRSNDAGATWNAVAPNTSTAQLYAASIAPQEPALMAIGGWGCGVHVSADAGKTWANRSDGLPSDHIFVLAFDPHQANRLWASTFEEGSYYSDDLGQTWQDGGLYGAYGADFVFSEP